MIDYKTIGDAAVFHCVGDQSAAFEMVTTILAGILAGGDAFHRAAAEAHGLLNAYNNIPQPAAICCPDDSLIFPLSQIDDEEHVDGFIQSIIKLDKNRYEVGENKPAQVAKIDLALVHLGFLMMSDELTADHWRIIRIVYRSLITELEHAKSFYSKLEARHVSR